MSKPHSVAEAQQQSLLELIEKDRDEKVAALDKQSTREAHQQVRAAFHQARERVSKAIKEERARIKEQLDATRAQLQTRARQRHHQAVLYQLRQAWELLHEALLERWHDADRRETWVRGCIDSAIELLPGGAWTIEHAPGWDPEELAPVRERIDEHTGGRLEFRYDDTIAAGLRVRAQGAYLDATLEGLLDDRTAAESKLLVEFERLARKRRPAHKGSDDDHE